ncbi:MAG: hypothetical protein JWM78_2304 [Verrucomicrobiaceae bacterium]|nr:hypothetical protein [Verrucomicrobiaceae bacterium]
MIRNTIFAASIFLAANITFAADAEQTPAAQRYTFSWSLTADQVKPRGGTTHGADVTLDTSESPAWIALQEVGISDLERDRRAILAMAGTYRVTFDFLETIPFVALDKPNAPYQSWGTEKIYVDIDDGKFISLLHILEMHMVEADGKPSEPIVVKHWRQDWRFEPKDIVEYVGNDRWAKRSLNTEKNLWSQTVYQVDESPRYAGVGRWEHSAAFSSWLSNDTARPLPRREWSVRKDYQVLRGTNRHTIVPSGWVQEENNLKTVLNAQRQLDTTRPYLAREYGVGRYERIRDEGFAEADTYFERTRSFWKEVRTTWAEKFKKYTSITLRGPVDQLGLFEPLFTQADQLAENPSAGAEKNADVIHSALSNMGAPN